MKELKFKHELAKKILSGEKTTTWRLFDDKDLTEGDEVVFVDSDTGNEFARVRLVKIDEQRLGEMREEDFLGHEKYESVEEMLETFKRYYGDGVNLESVVKVVRFVVV